MRKYIDIQLADRTITTTEVSADQAARAGRYFIAKTLTDMGTAACDPLSPDNPLIFSAGPFAGTNLSNANRISVGCKSPLTGGIKESNSGGTFAVAMGHLSIAGFTLHGASDEWVVLHVARDGNITFHPAGRYLGKGNFAAAALLHEDFGEKVSLALCGPVGEYRGLLAGIAFSDRERRPARLAARGGVGAVMGAKKVKAIVIDFDKMPELADRKAYMGNVKDYFRKLDESAPVKTLKELGTASVADFTNYMGGMPVRNFSAGQLVDPKVERLKVGGDYIRELNSGRGGHTSHACMPGCAIQCSNVYVDDKGQELVSPLEYETLGLLGTNCGVNDPDDIARLNWVANDLGIDSIELGGMLGVLLEAKLAEFGDLAFMQAALDDIRAGTARGKLLAQGAGRVGAHYGVRRVPVIKNQALSAYDPRVIVVTGISMMVTAQGADHTTGNLPAMDCNGKSLEELVQASFDIQVMCAIVDSVGLCVFGRSVTNTNLDLVADAINNALGTKFTADELLAMGRETLRLEREFNRRAGMDDNNDVLPEFFYAEALPPTGKTVQLPADAVVRHYEALLAATA